jgi:predicted metal-dependent phosphoesterase TrpH
MKPLKVDLHIHTKEDKEDSISYSAYQLIDEAALRDFDALAITNHDTLTYSHELRSYAAARGIVLIPGVEAAIRGKHILLVNMPFKNGSYNSFIAPHPYFPGPDSLDGQLEAAPHLFDAVEYCHLRTDRIDFNRQAVRFAEKYGLPVVGNSDAHVLDQFGLAYSLVEAEKTPDAIIEAIKAGQVKPVSQSLSLALAIRIFVRVAVTKNFTWTRPIELTCTGVAVIKHLLDGRS